MIRGGKAAARALLHTRILLKADQGSEITAWSDEAISTALVVHATTVARVRQRFVEQGLAAALRPKPTTRPYARKLDGVAEAPLLALACGPAPEGRAHWTLRLLADKFVELRHVPTVSYETIRRTLKKPTTTAFAAVLGNTARTQCRICRRDGRRIDGLSTPAGCGSFSDLYG